MGEGLMGRGRIGALRDAASRRFLSARPHCRRLMERDVARGDLHVVGRTNPDEATGGAMAANANRAGFWRTPTPPRNAAEQRVGEEETPSDLIRLLVRERAIA